MLIRPIPLPDELDEGYTGCVMRLNGGRCMTQFNQLMREWAGCTEKTGREITRLELISRVAGLSVAEFVQGHTSLPLRRGITSYQADLPHGSDQNRKIWYTSAMRAVRPGAYFCEDCVQEDLGFHGRSYWRRSHQVPGLLCCRKHGVPLNFCRESSAFHQAPSHWIETSESVPEAWIRQVMENKMIVRYLEICDGLFDSTQPFDVRHVRAVLFQKGVLLGLQTYAGKVNAPLLSDLVIEKCGRNWLALVMPRLAEKPDKEPLTAIDGVFYLKKAASTTFAYVLACALLFESADEAINALAGATPIGESLYERQRRDIAPDLLISAYIDAGGNYLRTAGLLGTTVSAVKSRLAPLGFPNMTEAVGKSTLKALSAFAYQGAAFQQSAEIGGIPLSDFEQAIRIMVKSLMKKVFRPEARGGKRARRSSPLMPDEAERMQTSGRSPAE